MHDRQAVLEVGRVLVLVQGGILLTSTLETVVAASVLGPSPATLVTGTAAVLTLAAAAGLVRGARWARRVTLLGEAFLLLTLVIDLGWSLLVSRASLGVMPLLSRGVLPMAVWAILHRQTAEVPS